MSGRGALTRIIVIQPESASAADEQAEAAPELPQESGTE
jgi:hypothetical protein